MMFFKQVLLCFLILPSIYGAQATAKIQPSKKSWTEQYSKEILEKMRYTIAYAAELRRRQILRRKAHMMQVKLLENAALLAELLLENGTFFEPHMLKLLEQYRDA